MEQETTNSGSKRDSKGRFTKESAAKFGAKGGSAKKDSISIVTIIKRKLQDCVSEEDKRQKAEFLAEKWINEAMYTDDFKKLQEIVRYIDGMPKQSIDHNGDISFNIVKYGDNDTE